MIKTTLFLGVMLLSVNLSAEVVELKLKNIHDHFINEAVEKKIGFNHLGIYTDSHQNPEDKNGLPISVEEWESVQEILYLDPHTNTRFIPVVVKLVCGQALPAFIATQSEFVKSFDPLQEVKGAHLYTFESPSEKPKVTQVERILSIKRNIKKNTDIEKRCLSFQLKYEEVILKQNALKQASYQIQSKTTPTSTGSVSFRILNLETLEKNENKKRSELKIKGDFESMIRTVFSLKSLPQKKVTWATKDSPSGLEFIKQSPNGDALFYDLSLPFSFSGIETAAVSIRSESYALAKSNSEETIPVSWVDPLITSINRYLEKRITETELLLFLNDHIDWEDILKVYREEEREKKKDMLVNILLRQVQATQTFVTDPKVLLNKITHLLKGMKKVKDMQDVYATHVILTQFWDKANPKMGATLVCKKTPSGKIVLRLVML